MTEKNKIGLKKSEAKKCIKVYEPTMKDRIEGKRDMKELQRLGYEYGFDFRFEYDSFTNKNYLFVKGGM